MMDKVLIRRGINRRKISGRIFKEQPGSPEKLIKDTKYLQYVIKPKSRGKWLLSYIKLGKDSIETQDFPLGFLAELEDLFPEALYSLKLRIGILLLDLSAKRAIKEYRIIKETPKIKIDVATEDAGGGALRTKGSIIGENLTKKELLKFLYRYLEDVLTKGVLSGADYGEFEIHFDNGFIKLHFDGMRLTFNFSKDIMERAAQVLANRFGLDKAIIKPGFSIFWYADIKEIEGGWKGPRHGWLVKKVISGGDKIVRRYKF